MQGVLTAVHDRLEYLSGRQADLLSAFSSALGGLDSRITSAGASLDPDAVRTALASCRCHSSLCPRCPAQVFLRVSLQVP